MRSLFAAASACALVACSGATTPDPNTDPTDPGTTAETTPDPTTDPTDPGTTPDGCTYPDSVEPMALGEALAPYSWSAARHRDGRQGELSLQNVFCDSDPDVDWSPFDVLLFVSIPAW
ncbi:MAG: hypothetical protein KTR31_00830 [Myxococcales bacterium]|nr:hypothetical protein [Myxococcales bacterium]